MNNTGISLARASAFRCNRAILSPLRWLWVFMVSSVWLPGFWDFDDVPISKQRIVQCNGCFIIVLFRKASIRMRGSVKQGLKYNKISVN